MRRIQLAFLLTTIACYAIPVRAEKPIDFQQDIAPIFEQHCLHCHSDNISKGDLSLTTAQGLLQNEYLRAGLPNDSHLIDLISGDDPAMPQDGAPLTSDQVNAIRLWIKAGATWPDDIMLRERSKADHSWWSLQPLAPYDAAASIDQFIETELANKGLTINPPADRRTLIRRATYDLTGLPPSPEQVEAFVRNDDPQAYEKLVDRLLSSPHYGERWGRPLAGRRQVRREQWFREKRHHQRSLAVPGLRDPIP